MGSFILKIGPNLPENAEDSGKMVAPEFEPLAISFSKLCAEVIHSAVRINHLHSGRRLAYFGQIEGGPKHSYVLDFALKVKSRWSVACEYLYI